MAIVGIDMLDFWGVYQGIMDPGSHDFIDPETFLANGLYKGRAIWSDIARYL